LFELLAAQAGKIIARHPVKNATGIILLTVGLLLPLMAQAQGTLYVSNLGQTPTDSAAIGSDSWIAQQFYTGTNADGYVLNSIQLLMDAASGSPSGFTVSIYSFNNSNYGPGSDLGSLSGSDPSAGGIFTYTASGLTLSPSTAYFIVLTAATPVAQGAYAWSLGQQYAGGSDQWEIFPDYESSANGSSWDSHARSNTFQLAVYATAVPEPSLLGLSPLGVLLLTWRRWKARAI
jgi:hypothetical protein